MGARNRPPLGAIRRGLGLTQAELAASTGYARSSISLVEAGHVRPWKALRQSVSATIGAPERVVFGREHPT